MARLEPRQKVRKGSEREISSLCLYMLLYLVWLRPFASQLVYTRVHVCRTSVRASPGFIIIGTLHHRHDCGMDGWARY